MARRSVDLEQRSTLALVAESEKLGSFCFATQGDLLDSRVKLRRKLRFRRSSKFGISRSRSIDPGDKTLDLSITLDERKVGLTPYFYSTDSFKKPTFLSQVDWKNSELASFAVKEKLKHPEAHCIYIPRDIRVNSTNLAREWTAVQTQMRIKKAQAQGNSLLPPLRVGVYRQKRR